MARRPAQGRRCHTGIWCVLFAGLLLAGRTPVAAAHSGPPYALAENQSVGPYTVAVWADPDIGAGRIMVQLKAPPAALPKVTVAARPLDGHTGEAVVLAEQGGPYQTVGADTWLATMPFDTPGTWALTITLDGPDGSGSFKVPVDARPDGPSQGEAWLFALPFALLAGAWLVARLRHRPGHQVVIAADPPAGDRP